MTALGRTVMVGMGAVALLAGGTGLAGTAEAAPAAASPSAVVHRAKPHIMPIRGSARAARAGQASRQSTPTETRVCNGCTPPLLYGGGPVMGTAGTVGEVTITPIFWAPPGTSFPATYTATINKYLTDVAAASGTANNVYSVDTEYSNIHYLTHFGGAQTDTHAFPATQCPIDPGFTRCVNDPELTAEVGRYLGANSLPAGFGHLYPVFFPPGIETGDGAGGTSATTYCGYHSIFQTGGGASVIYANEPYPNLNGCGSGQAPNGPFADAALDTLSHEINESVTDPDTVMGWLDSTGNEIGDECSNIYGVPGGSTDPNNASTTEYNQVINGDHYYTQQEFSNADFAKGGQHGCVQSENQVTGQTPPTDTVTVTAMPASIPADGASTSAIVVHVANSAGAPVAGDTVNLNTGAVGQSSATCGTVSPQTGTTDSSGNVSVTYTASTAVLACDVIANEAQTGQGGKAAVTQTAGPPPPPEAYNPLPPTRIYDSRPGSGEPGAGSPIAFGSSATVHVSGAPSGSTAVLSVTAADGTAPGFLTVFGAGQPKPLASSLDYVAGGPGCGVADCVVPNLVTVPIGAGGNVSIFNGPAGAGGSVDLVVDLEGYYAAAPASGAGHYNALTPARLADTRCAASPQPGFCSAENLPGANSQLGSVQPGTGGILGVAVRGQGGVAMGSAAAVLNVTVTNTSGPGFLTAFPEGSQPPLASNLDWVAGQTTSNRVIVPVGGDGKVDFFNGAVGPVDVVVDVVGYFSDASAPATAGSLFTPVTPVRVFDTRPGSGQGAAGQTLAAGDNLPTPFAGQGQVPAGATAVAVNLTDVNATAASFFTLAPSAPANVPSSSDLNFGPGEVRANADLATLGGAGGADLFNLAGSVDAVIDLAGYFTRATPS